MEKVLRVFTYFNWEGILVNIEADKHFIIYSSDGR